MSQQYVLTVGNGLLTKGGYSLGVTPPDPLNPLNLPPYTIRCKFSTDYIPPWETKTLVDGDENIWDITTSYDDWTRMFSNKTELLSVLGANSANVSSMIGMFQGCVNLVSVATFSTASSRSSMAMFSGCTSLVSTTTLDLTNQVNIGEAFNNCSSLTSINLINTGNIQQMVGAFAGCTSLREAPVMDTHSVILMQYALSGCWNLGSFPDWDMSAVTNASNMMSNTPIRTIPEFNAPSLLNVSYMFNQCTYLESGALALYQKLSAKSPSVSTFNNCFSRCGEYAPQAAPIHAEMSQIPNSWGGLME